VKKGNPVRVVTDNFLAAAGGKKKGAQRRSLDDYRRLEGLSGIVPKKRRGAYPK